MEAAFDGVKSNRQRLLGRTEAGYNDLSSQLDDELGSVYIRVMKSAPPQQNQFFRFLRRLRAGGRSNMYGAVPYLMKTFRLDRQAAFRVVCEWLDQQAEPEATPSTPNRQNSRGARSAARSTQS